MNDFRLLGKSYAHLVLFRPSLEFHDIFTSTEFYLDQIQIPMRHLPRPSFIVRSVNCYVSFSQTTFLCTEFEFLKSFTSTVSYLNRIQIPI